MYTVIVVDDEDCVREFIVEYIEKEDNGFSVVKSFGDAKVAFEYIKTNSVDLVITDIKMPGWTGLDLAKQINENNIDTSVIIISGYDEFEYAKRAIEYNVFHYILKPIDFFELDDILRKKKKMLDEKKEIYDIDDIKKELFFTKLIFGGFSDSREIEESYKDIDFTNSPKDIYIEIFQVCLTNADIFFKDYWCYGKERFENFVKNLVCKNYPDTYVFSFKVVYDKFYFVLVSKKTSNTVIDYSYLTDTAQKLLRFDLRFIKLLFNENIIDITYPITDFESVFVKDKVPFSNNDFISKAQKFVEKNYVNDISREDISDYLFISKSYVDKIFKQELGITFCEYLQDFRMKKTLELLRENMKISDIAQRVGYNNTRHFLRIFKSCYGCTPKEYKIKMLRKDLWNDENI